MSTAQSNPRLTDVSRCARALRRAESSSWPSSPSAPGGVGVAAVLAGQLGQRPLDLAPDPADRDAEHALAALDQVDDLVGGGALVDAGAVAHQRDLGQVVDAALAQVVDRGADVLQRDAGVEQALDHLEHQDVAEAVEPLAARAGRAADAGLDQAGPGPVVELAVGDAGGRAGGRPAVAHVLGQLRQVVGEQQALLAGPRAGTLLGGPVAAGRAARRGVAHADLRLTPRGEGPRGPRPRAEDHTGGTTGGAFSSERYGPAGAGSTTPRRVGGLSLDLGWRFSCAVRQGPGSPRARSGPGTPGTSRPRPPARLVRDADPRLGRAPPRRRRSACWCAARRRWRRTAGR